MGTLSSDLTLTSQPSGAPVSEFTVMVDLHGKDDTVFHLYIPCKAWGTTAASMCERGETGQTVGIDGKLAYDKEAKGVYVLVSSVTIKRTPASAAKSPQHV